MTMWGCGSVLAMPSATPHIMVLSCMFIWDRLYQCCCNCCTIHSQRSGRMQPVGNNTQHNIDTLLAWSCCLQVSFFALKFSSRLPHLLSTVRCSRLRPMSDTQQIQATLSRNFVAQQRSANNRQTDVASSDTDDDIIISSALLTASTLYQGRQVNVRNGKRNSWARKQIIDQSQLGDRVKNCQRIEIVSI